MGNYTSPCEPKCRAAVSRSTSCFLPLFKAVIFVFKGFRACESRASAERGASRSCAVAFLRVCTLPENCSDPSIPTRFSIYLQCHALLCTSFQQAHGEERSMFCIHGVREGSWTWGDLLTFNEELNLFCVWVFFFLFLL